MSKDYNVDDILSEIKAKKSRQVRAENSPKTQQVPHKLAPNLPESEPIIFKESESESNSKPKPTKLFTSEAHLIPDAHEPLETSTAGPDLLVFKSHAEKLAPSEPVAPPPPPPKAVEPAATAKAPRPDSHKPAPSGSTPFFSGFDAPDEALFRPAKKTASEPPKIRKAPDYQKYFESIEIQDDISEALEPPQKAPPTKEDKLDESSIFSTGYIFPQIEAEKDAEEKAEKSAPANSESESVPLFNADNINNTTLFNNAIQDDYTLPINININKNINKSTAENNQESAPPEISSNIPDISDESTTAAQSDKFKITLPDDVMVDDEVPSLFPPDEPAPDTKERKRKNLFSRNRTPLEGEPSSEPASRLASSDVPVPEAFAEESDGEIDDYSSPEDKEAILKDMKSIKFSLLLRIALMLVVFAISLYLSLASRDIKINAAGDLLPLLDMLWPETHFRTYMIVSTAIAALSALICSNTVGGGILSLLKFHANTDSLPALAVLGALGQGICFIVRPEFFNADRAHLGENLYFFFPVAAFVLLFNLIGKLMVILRIQNNFKLVAADKAKYSVAFLKEKNLLREITKGLSMQEYTVAYPERAKFLSGFLDNSYSEDHAEGMSRILAPLCLLASIALAVIAYLFHKSIPEAITTFTAVLCICAPLTSTIAANLPLLRLSSTLVPLGAMVSGYSAVDAFSRTEAVVMGACDVFRPENVVLHGIKSFDQGKIDAVILDAASVVCSTNGMLTCVFSKIIGSNKSMLKPVENIAYEDSMGLSAWVDGKRVLIGNRELMQNHGVDVPSNDYEMRYVKDSKNIIYLANSGTLSAMFVISYNPSAAVREELDKLVERGMYLIVETSDPNITIEKIRSAYDFPIEQMRLLPAKFHSAYLSLTAEKNQAPAKIGLLSSGKNMIQAICACAKARASVEMAVMIQMIALVLGYGLVALFSLMGNLTMLSVIHVLLFQSLWAIIGITIPNAKKF